MDANAGHHCLTDPDSGFPEPGSMPDVGTDGETGGRYSQGPFTHACRTCGEGFVWREIAGFVIWVPQDPGGWEAVYDRLRHVEPSAAERAQGRVKPPVA